MKTYVLMKMTTFVLLVRCVYDPTAVQRSGTRTKTRVASCRYPRCQHPQRAQCHPVGAGRTEQHAGSEDSLQTVIATRSR